MNCPPLERLEILLTPQPAGAAATAGAWSAEQAPAERGCAP
jgi:hypothetical protein